VNESASPENWVDASRRSRMNVSKIWGIRKSTSLRTFQGSSLDDRSKYGFRVADPSSVWPRSATGGRRHRERWCRNDLGAIAAGGLRPGSCSPPTAIALAEIS
jgi:hypothetical protein